MSFGRAPTRDAVNASTIHVSDRYQFQDSRNMCSDIACMRFGQGKEKWSDHAQQSMAKVMADMLSEHPDLVNEQEEGDSHRSAGQYPIHRACEAGNIHALKVILATPGVNLEARKNNGCTALHSAIFAFGNGSVNNPMAGAEISPDEWEKRCLQNFRALLRAGADVSANHSSRFWTGFDPLIACVSHEYSREDVCLPMVKALIERGALMNSKHHVNGATALLFALRKGHSRCAEQLLLAGADPTIEGDMGHELGRVSAVEFARRVPHHENPVDDPCRILARVAAVILDMAGKSLGLKYPESDASAILRCKADLRRRETLTALVSRGRFTDAHQAHAVRAYRVAKEMLESGQFMEARLAYADALLWGVLRLDLQFECVNNWIACLCMGSPDLFVAKQLAGELCENFPQRAGSWLQMGKVLWELEHHHKLVFARSRTEGLATEAEAEARKQTKLALEECLLKARAAPDAPEHASQLEALAKAAEHVEVTQEYAMANELYMEAMRIQQEDERTPSHLARAIDLCAQSMQVGGALIGPLQLGAAAKLELATCLSQALRGRDNLIALADHATVLDGSELRVKELLGLLADRLPTSACQWMAAAAKLSRSWRAAAMYTLQCQGLEGISDVIRRRESSGSGATSHDLILRFNYVTALASLGRFDEARMEGRKLWCMRLQANSSLTAAGDGGDNNNNNNNDAMNEPIEDDWGGWAHLLTNSIKHGGRLMGQCPDDLASEIGSAAPVCMIQATINAMRADICEAIISHAEARCAQGAPPRVLSRLMLAAEEVGGAFEVPPALLQAISGWAGERGVGLSSHQLDDLWSRMLLNVRRSTTEAMAAEAKAEEEMRQLSFLPRELVKQDGDSGARSATALAAERKGKKKKGKGKSKGKAAVAPQEGETEEDSSPVTTGEAGSSGGAAALELDVEQAEVGECGICLALMDDPVLAPCSGKHAHCRTCWGAWRLETLKQGTEFSCPMCRESLEGWEP